MARDMRNRFLVALIFTVPLVLWSMVGTELLGKGPGDRLIGATINKNGTLRAWSSSSPSEAHRMNSSYLAWAAAAGYARQRAPVLPNSVVTAG